MCVCVPVSFKNTKIHTERRALVYIFYGNIISYRTKLTNSDFCLNFSAGEAHTKVKGV